MKYTVQRNHPLVQTNEFKTIEEYVLLLMHQKAYENASALCRGRTVLDWGCNNGYGFPILAKSALRVGGVDTNEACVQEARLLHPEYASDIWLFDGQHIPVPEKYWDVVVSFQVIEHVQNVSAYLDDIVSVMKDTGIALFTTPNRAIRLDDGMRPWNEFHVTEFSAADLGTVLRKHFQHVEIYGMQGDAEMIDIERNRCSRARAIARASRTVPHRIWNRFRSLIKSTAGAVLTPEVVARLRHRYRGTRPEPMKQRLPDSVIERFSTSRIHYTKDDLGTAVDLLAVCSNQEIEFPIA